MPQELGSAGVNIDENFERIDTLILGNIIGNTNNNNKCTKERIMMSNKAYYANRQLVNSSLE